MIQVAIPDDWNGDDFCKFAVCWPDSPKWKSILSGLIENPTQGRFWDFRTGNFLELREKFKSAYDYNFTLKECIMTCGDNGIEQVAQSLSLVAQAINNISLSINNTSNYSCCDKVGSGGAGQAQPPYSGTNQGEPGIDDPPTGYETWEEFLNDKCAIANMIVNRLEEDLGTLLMAQIATMDLGALAALVAAVLATPIPFDDILALAGLLLSIAASIVIASTLDIINSNESELVCELYNSTNAAGASSAFKSKFAELADDYFTDPIEKFASKRIIDYFMGATVTNELYVKNHQMQYPSADCGDCEEVLSLILLSGSGDITVNGESRLLTSELDVNGHHYISILQCNEYCDPPSDNDCANFTWEVTGVTGSPVYEINQVTCEGTWVHGAGASVQVGHCAVAKHFRVYKPGNNPFSVELKISEGGVGCA